MQIILRFLSLRTYFIVSEWIRMDKIPQITYLLLKRNIRAIRHIDRREQTNLPCYDFQVLDKEALICKSRNIKHINLRKGTLS